MVLGQARGYKDPGEQGSPGLDAEDAYDRSLTGWRGQRRGPAASTAEECDTDTNTGSHGRACTLLRSFGRLGGW